MIKIAHEAPNSIFNNIMELTDYDYCLVHLYVENELYRDNFIHSKLSGREVILDNSIFELGKAFDQEKYVEVIKELKPDWYIVPDVLEDKKGTLLNYYYFTSQNKELPGKPIGVIQGKDYEELLECYRFYSEVGGIGMIAISFDYSYYEKLHPSLPKYKAWMKGRIDSLFRLSKEKSFRKDIPLHLLGCSLPQEFEFYIDSGLPIYSLDTSSPVVHGMLGVIYQPTGLKSKESIKLHKMIDHTISYEQLQDIVYNIRAFKRLVG